MFEKDGITIGINFLAGKAAQLSYSKPSGSSFLDIEVQKLLEVNSAGSGWRYDPAETERGKSSAYSKKECFKRDDGGAFAEHFRIALVKTEFVVIASSDYRKATAAKQLQGF